MKAKRSKLADKIVQNEKLSRKILDRTIKGEDKFIESGYKITKLK